MGAETYTINAKGTNVKKIFNNLVEEALYRHGHDSYNGTISTTSLGANITNKIPANILKSSKKLSDFINDWENNDSILFPEKWHRCRS